MVVAAAEIWLATKFSAAVMSPPFLLPLPSPRPPPRFLFNAAVADVVANAVDFLADCCLFHCRRHHPVHRRCRVNVVVAVAVANANANADSDAVAVAVTIYVAISSLFSFTATVIVINVAGDVVVDVAITIAAAIANTA